MKRSFLHQTARWRGLRGLVGQEDRAVRDPGGVDALLVNAEHVREVVEQVLDLKTARRAGF